MPGLHYLILASPQVHVHKFTDFLDLRLIAAKYYV